MASRWANFLNDIVVDPIRRVAFITNPNQTSLVVFDEEAGDSWAFSHESMANSIESTILPFGSPDLNP